MEGEISENLTPQEDLPGKNWDVAKLVESLKSQSAKERFLALSTLTEKKLPKSPENTEDVDIEGFVEIIQQNDHLLFDPDPGVRKMIAAFLNGIWRKHEESRLLAQELLEKMKESEKDPMIKRILYPEKTGFIM